MSEEKSKSEFTCLFAVGETARGFEKIEFNDRDGRKCNLQQSSLVDYTDRGMKQPGSSFVWLGCCGDVPIGGRMHLTRKDVHRLICHLQQWLRTGSFVVSIQSSED